MTRENINRFIFGFIALLFIATAFVGVYAFVANTSSSPAKQADNYIKCPLQPITAKQATKDGKLKGAKLAGFTPLKHIDFLKCQDLKVGSGATATASSSITANYTGALASDGTIFESSIDSGAPFTTTLNQVIPGWTAGIPGMKVGGERRLLIPAQNAYGDRGSCQVPDPHDSTKCLVYGIPPNSDLVFDITLLGVK